MTDIVFWILGILVVGVTAWIMGSKGGQRRLLAEVSSLLKDLRAGRSPKSTPTAGRESDPVRELRSVLAQEWVPRGAEREEAMGDALKRIASYLRHRVEVPLLEGLEKGGRSLQGGADAALDAVEDLEFFLEDPAPTGQPESYNLAEIIRGVTREYTSQSDILVKVEAPSEPIRVRVTPEAFKDAVFLILHNAGEFGGGKAVRVSLGREGQNAHLKIQDDGPGFSAEALLEAHDPFYSTSPGGLGLGLPHARKIIKRQGGEIYLRNAEGGGAEVEIVLPEGG
ncbi:ATP-binding protein [Gemmatimonadota bacterium]